MKKALRSSLPVLISCALLITMAMTQIAGTFRQQPEVAAYFSRVSDGIESIPLQTGPWLGVDIPVIPAAQELLQPNKILQRRYVNADTREWFELLIVHCGDVRDMTGHYPPVCYKANGWTLEQKERVTVRVGEVEAPATRYSFHREEDLVKNAIRIVNVFALPVSNQSGFSEDLAEVERAGRSRLRARMGSAQVQVIAPATLSLEQQEMIFELAMELVTPVLTDVERGPM